MTVISSGRGIIRSARTIGSFKNIGMALSAVALLSSCGGGGGGGGSGANPSPPVAGPAPAPPPPPPPAAIACSLRDRQDWAAAQLNEWYLFPELLAAGLNPDSFTTVKDYIDALVAPARAQNKDRFFTRISSMTDGDEFLGSGSSIGFGFLLSTDAAAGRAFVSESYEGAPALAANIDRGTEILAIGASASELKTVSSIIAAEGAEGVSAAFGAATVGLSRLLRVRDPNGTTRDVTLSKAAYTVDPVSNRYGALILNDNGKSVGYLNFRTFIGAPAEAGLRGAFAQFRAQGITEVIVDLRYNGGGLTSTAALLSNLLQGNRSTSDVMSHVTFRASKSGNNSTTYFAPQPQSISATRIAFIATGSSRSASEAVMNVALPYLGANAALIGSDTAGKPVGQKFLDRPACDDRLIAVAFATRNANQQGDYYDGLASKFQSTCSAPDDIQRALGDPQEASIRAALDFLAGRPCAPISGGAAAASGEVKPIIS
ncbi:MAG TPA: S41 family peptidase [Allosphingosinicella sp.]|jgi:C-terminal processing protease CtpA/Prc